VNRFEWRIAWRYLGAQRKSFLVSLISMFSMLGVFIGTLALVVVLSAINGFEEEVTLQMIRKDAHFEVMSFHERPIAKADSLIEAIGKFPGTVKVMPFVVGKLGISSRKVNDGIAFFGIDPSLAEGVIGLKENMLYGEYSLDSTKDRQGKLMPGIILGSVLASRLDVLLGDKVILQTFQSPEAGIGPTVQMMQFVVSGLFESGMYEYDANLAYVHLREAQKLLLLGDQVLGIQGTIKDPMSSEIYARELEKFLGYPYYVNDWKAKNQSLLKWMAIEKILFGAVIFLIIIVAAFNIISSLIMLVLEKTREIGILRSMGTTQGSILRIFILTGGIIGLIGTLLGLAGGLLICWSQVQYGWVKLPPDVYMISVFPVKIMWQDIVSIFLISNFLCFTATILPAWRASRLDPVKAIRYE
jgi:lipoprotein-releasing system permease protein